jgi:hypothetical protein
MRKIVLVLLIANLIFWVWFWIDLATRLRPIPAAGFDDVTPPPVYLFGDKCIPPFPIPYLSVPFRAQTVLQAPSILAARLIQRILFRSRFDSSMIAGVSLAAWRVILITCISFLQWYLIGWAIQKLWHRWSSRQTAAPNQASSTTTTG